MNPTIAFFFKARHGFGHMRRTLLIADELHALDPSVEIFLISQVRSLLPMLETAHRVINFPLLHRLPNDALQGALLDLLGAVVSQIAPDLIVEDTFPDRNHLLLPAFREVRKALVVRKLSGVFFERIRQRGELRPYDRILVAQDHAGFAASGHSPDSLLLAELCERFEFFGPVFHLPSLSEVAAVRARYGEQPLIVAAAGAGGDTGNQGFTEQFFGSMSTVAARWARRQVPLRFVFVTGPYYGGRPPPAMENVTTVTYEPMLSALLHAARIAVIRPGFNSLHEGIHGPARLVLVPGHNAAEDQRGDADRLAVQDGIDVSEVGDIERLDELVRANIEAPPRVPSAAQPPAQRAMAAALLSELHLARRAEATGPTGRAFILLGGLDTAHGRAAAAAALPEAPQVGVDVGRYSDLKAGRTAQSVVMVDVAPDFTVTPGAFRTMGVRVLLMPGGGDYDDQADTQLVDWLRCYELRGHGLLAVGLHHIHAAPHGAGDIRYRLCRLRDEEVVPALYVDLRRMTSTGAVSTYLAELRHWLAASGYRICPVREFVSIQAARQLG